MKYYLARTPTWTKTLSNIDCQECFIASSYSIHEDAVCTAQLKKSCRKGEQVSEAYNKVGVGNIGAEDTTEFGEAPPVPSSEISTSVLQNYFYICGKPQ